MSAICLKTVLILGTLWTASYQSCITFNRYDLMEQWKIKEDSPVCQLKSNIPDVADRYSLRAIGQRMLVESYNFTIDFDDNWISEKFNFNYSISINKDNLDYPHFVTFMPTDNPKEEGTYIYSEKDGIRGFRRTIFYINFDHISTHGNKNVLIMLIVLCVIFGSFAVLSVFGRIMNFGVAFMAVFILGFSLITGMWVIPSLGGFLAMLIILGIIASSLAIVNWKFFHTYGSIAFGLTVTLYYLVGTSNEYKYSYAIVGPALAGVSFWFAYKLPGMMLLDKCKVFGLHFSFWLLQYSFWAHIFIIYPAELYIRMRMGDWNYRVGRTGKGIILYWPMIVAGVGAVVLAVVSGFTALSRTGRASYGPDSAQGGYKPLI